MSAETTYVELLRAIARAKRDRKRIIAAVLANQEPCS